MGQKQKDLITKFLKHSSKRFWGSVLISIGCLMLVTLFVISLFHPVADSKTAFDTAITCVSAGCSLLGFTLFERSKPESQK